MLWFFQEIHTSLCPSVGHLGRLFAFNHCVLFGHHQCFLLIITEWPQGKRHMPVVGRDCFSWQHWKSQYLVLTQAQVWETVFWEASTMKMVGIFCAVLNDWQDKAKKENKPGASLYLGNFPGFALDSEKGNFYSGCALENLTWFWLIKTKKQQYLHILTHPIWGNHCLQAPPKESSPLDPLFW